MGINFLGKDFNNVNYQTFYIFDNNSHSYFHKHKFWIDVKSHSCLRHLCSRKSKKTKRSWIWIHYVQATWLQVWDFKEKINNSTTFFKVVWGFIQSSHRLSISLKQQHEPGPPLPWPGRIMFCVHPTIKYPEHTLYSSKGIEYITKTEAQNPLLHHLICIIKRHLSFYLHNWSWQFLVLILQGVARRNTNQQLPFEESLHHRKNKFIHHEPVIFTWGGISFSGLIYYHLKRWLRHHHVTHHTALELCSNLA